MTGNCVYVGIDGGGTKTDLAMVDADGNLLARVQGETSNKAVVGLDRAVQVIQSLLDRAIEQAGSDHRVAAGWIGMAGADRPEDRDAFMAALAPRFSELRITNDGELVLSGTPTGTGIALIAGTGSIAFARNEQGESARSGGWGHIFGDEGSAYIVAVDALRAVAAEADGRGPATSLTKRLTDWWNADRPQQLITKVYDQAVKKADIAASAPVVVEAAESGDAVALGILHKAGDDLAALVESLLRRVSFAEPPTVAGTGGLLLRTSIVRERVESHLDPSTVTPSIRTVDDIAVSVALAVARDTTEGQS